MERFLYDNGLHHDRVNWTAKGGLKINPFHATDLFWYPLNTSENQRYSDVFKRYQK